MERRVELNNRRAIRDSIINEFANDTNIIRWIIIGDSVLYIGTPKILDF